MKTKTISAILMAGIIAAFAMTATACDRTSTSTEKDTNTTDISKTEDTNTTATSKTEGTATNPAPVADNSYSEDYDGVVLTVVLDKSVYKLDDVIYITATVKNNTNETIGLYMPVTGINSHTEVSTRITNDNENYLVDIDTFNTVFDDALDSRIIEPGQEYVQTMRFATYTGYEESNKIIAATGDYNGRAEIGLLSEPTNTTSSQTVRLLEFGITIE